MKNFNQFVTEAVETSASTKAKKMGLVWKGKGYGPENKKGITHKVSKNY